MIVQVFSISHVLLHHPPDKVSFDPATERCKLLVCEFVCFWEPGSYSLPAAVIVSVCCPSGAGLFKYSTIVCISSVACKVLHHCCTSVFNIVGWSQSVLLVKVCPLP